MPLEIHKLYGGEVELHFETKRHLYTVGERVVPSVTGITSVMDKPALVPWAANTCAEYVRQHLKPGVALDEVEIEEFAESLRKEWRKVSRRAANTGTVVHAYAEKWARFCMGKGEEPARPVNPAAARGVDAFHSWLDSHTVEFLYAEKKVYSRQYGYAGTVDLVARIDGVVTLADYKTSSGWWEEYDAQVAAYREAVEEELDLGIGRSLGLLFNKETGEFQPVHIQDHDGDVMAFLNMLSLSVWKQGKRNARKK